MRRMGWLVMGLCVGGLPAWMAQAEQKRSTGDQVLEGVLTSVLGGAPSTTTYTTQERDRLVSMLQSGEYVTSRQGEPIDTVAFGVPLTSAAHVYTAKPIPPSRISQ